ncbi:O-antigen ligase family protein [Lutimonas vermicola]|uniref:O-antigen ligase family protein n=1 Tax=Lutimonas vermicola TaxID=414288 RepID=A0ABU9L445_9FLAO
MDSKGRLVVYLTIFVFLLNFITNSRFQRFSLSKPIIFWGVWIIYSAINLIITGYNGDLPFLWYLVLRLFTPFTVMLIVSVELYYAPKKILYVLLSTFIIYGLFILILVDNYSGFSGEQNVGAFGNMGPLNIMFIIFYSGLLFAHKWLKQQNLFFCILFAFLIIVLSATRKAFGAAVIMLTFIILSQIKLSPKKLVQVAVLSLITIWSINFALNNTTMGKRFTTIEESGMEYNTTDNETLNLLGDRAYFYIKGWSIFLEKPIAGIGLNNFPKIAESSYRIHSEYIVQITEGGIIGSSLFLFFYLWISLNLYNSWRKNKNNRSIILVLIGGFVAIIFINITAWTYEFSHYFACFGIIIGYLKKMK